MSCSEEETNAASVLSQMSQIQPNSSDTIEQQDMNVHVAHQCDVETTSLNCSQASLSTEESCPEGLPTPNELHPETDKTCTPTAFELCNNAPDTRLQATVEVALVKVFPCEFCGKVFNKSYNLKTHHRVHTGERPYPCPICGHGFANLGDLKRHARTHTGEKPFICEFCNKAFSDFGSHKRHLRLHTGFKPFKCDECDRQFTRLDSYKNHMRLHTGERPYKCDECQKEFNYLTTYKRHLNIHSGERPFSCELCGKRFTRMNYLRNHKLNHKKSTSNNGEKHNLPETAEMQAMEPVELQGSAVSQVSMSDLAEEHSRRNGNENNDDDVIQQVAEALSQGGLEVSVATVVESNGQPLVIQSPLDDHTCSGETAHTLILAQNVLDSSSSTNQPIVELTGNTTGEQHTEQAETRQLFLGQPLFKISQDTNNHADDITSTVSQFVEQTFDGIISVAQADGNVVDEFKVKDIGNQPQDILNSGSDGPGISMATNDSDVYIAIDPVQASGQHILGEIHVAVNPES